MTTADLILQGKADLDAVHAAGYEKGKAAGSGVDYDTVFAAGRDQGEKDAYDAFWDVYQQNGERTHYAYAFAGRGWDNAVFKPKYPIILTEAADSMFSNNMYLNSIDCDLDFSDCPSNTYLFNSCICLQRIKSIKFNNTGKNSYIFSSCNELRDITVNGTINFDLGMSGCTKLSADSVQSIIDALADLTGQAQKTVTFASAVSSALTSEQKDAISAKNWKLG